MRSRDFRDYVIVTKKPEYKLHYSGGSFDSERYKAIDENFSEETDKTFWLFTRDGELVGRYSVESAPQWIMQIYDIIVE